MDITQEITKEVFEKNVPAAKSPERNTSVFKRMEPYFQWEYKYLKNSFFGNDFETLMDTDDYKDVVIRFICVGAFLVAIPSLDLVLTGTGFGIVSTQDTAPASQQRIQSLTDQLRWEWLLTISDLFALLPSKSGWGDTKTARQAINSLYYDPRFLDTFGPEDPQKSKMDNWRYVLQRRHTAEVQLRRDISPEYYDALLDRIRHASMTDADEYVFRLCLKFISSCISNKDGQMLAGIRDSRYMIREYMEKNITEFPDYEKSDLYIQLHGEHYENKQQDSTFFFI
ncbi:MAG: hypothetical protein LKE54_03705 [Prevotella sp.]|jgi:hypothetical protein|nr:hypothetical protein [Prevotella sp.]